ncbi:MAG TPA: DUF6265 family protein [Terriglobales bacterium]|nr:DUF6265 family protein [Terriglobales bacterium]
MRILSRPLVLLVALFIASTQLHAADLVDLHWLTGSWLMQKGTMTIEEQWTKPAAGTMIGMSRTISKDRTVAFEFLRIVQRGTDLFYIAQPEGKPPTEFKLVRSSAKELVFENLAHDFPQQISYNLNEDGSVTARIEGPGKNGRKVIPFEFKKVKP